MAHARRQEGQPACKIIDFDEAWLNACDAEQRADLMAEAKLLAGAFAPSGGADLVRLAAELSAGRRDEEMNRAHARRLAAALKRLGKAEKA
ncbi:hypothetical protein [Phenylobacterium kunshanense]|uniref:Uncharacterized protein n=1 Tax=Phenylobacterium kunshanense TaxID=1445034 RepID=A0A328B6N4_9CAUL|nr:hypothetical protein [Phenylobacterium kunshanense]RAK63050.1 hypothetical protein DJ019_17405 [Phenylobacterium kunshanense]